MIKDFLAEEKAYRKQLKQQRKNKNKKSLTKEQKGVKVLGILFTIIMACVFFATNCTSSENGDINWAGSIGITEEHIEEMEKTVDENLLFPNGKITDDDWLSLTNKLKLAGLEIADDEGMLLEETDEEARLQGVVEITGREIGAMCKEMNSIFGYGTILNVNDYQIYKEGNKYYQKSIVYIDLKNMVSQLKLPSIYLTTISEVRPVAGQLKAMNYRLIINQLSEEMSAEILEKLNELTNDRLTRLANDTLNNYIYLFFSSIYVDYELIDGGLSLFAVE